MVGDNKFRLEMPDKKIEKEALYSFVVKTELHRPVAMSREAMIKYYDFVIVSSGVKGVVVEEFDGLDNDFHVLVLAGSKVFLWMYKVYICSIGLFRRVIQYIVRHRKRVEGSGSLKK
jgi:hypothetical protein